MRISDWSSDVCSSDLAAVSAALEEAVREHGLHLLPWPEVARALQARVGFARGHDSTLPALSDEALGRSIADWLPPLLQNIRRLDSISPERLTRVLQDMLGWEIGSASCRERVCQNVYTFVDDVAIQQKITQQL